MKPDESSFADDWLKIARTDFRRVSRCLRANDLEDAAFHLQQALEKYLKAFLLSKGWKLKRSHNLVDLLKDALIYLPALEEYRELCQEATQYYTIERYPLFMESGLERPDLLRLIARTKQLIDLIDSELGI